ncbi:MAG: urease accessory protein UreF [Scytolyngbya sp. HA4215-MV1]|jgi:urease accessory protein|nr:urease accessory protein UreF [Scytolyngbya sp. HA4215-MV1]
MPDLHSSLSLLGLLQLSSSTLPVGAYSYSEGLEALVEAGKIFHGESLQHWLAWELRYGSIQLEAAAMVRTYRAIATDDCAAILYWNAWLSAVRETEELRSQSWQMGRSLLRLLQDTQPNREPNPEMVTKLAEVQQVCGHHCNFAIAFALAATYWQIDERSALFGYLFSWANNLVGAGVRLIPLGQTIGQQILLNLHEAIELASQTILTLSDDDLAACGWGLSLASMTHETQYSRLFRS